MSLQLVDILNAAKDTAFRFSVSDEVFDADDGEQRSEWK
jgi:hypothetical protein